MIRGRLPDVRSVLPALVVCLLLGAAIGAGPASAASTATPWWQLDVQAVPTNLQPGAEGRIKVVATNVGDAQANGATDTIILRDRVPTQLEVLSNGIVAYAGTPLSLHGVAQRTKLSCTVSGQTVSCPFHGTLEPYETVQLSITVKVLEPPGTVTTLPNEATAEGGGTPSPVTRTDSLKVSPEVTRFGIVRYQLSPENEGGTLDMQAGSHPFQLTSSFDLNDKIETINILGGPYPGTVTPEVVKDLHFVVPPGLIGNATATPKCSGAAFSAVAEGAVNYCPGDTAVGVATVGLTANEDYNELIDSVPVFNLEPSQGEPARFGFEIEGVPVVLTTSVRTGSDYAVEVTLHQASEAAFVLKSQVTLWGTPQDPAHNISRGWECLEGGLWVAEAEPARPCSPLKASQPTAFLTLPTSCEGKPVSTVTGEAWTGGKLAAEYPFPSAFSGCSLLAFTPTISVEPEVQQASRPTGMTVKVHIPQTSTLSAAGLAEADARSTTLTLPEGIQASAGAANGLLTCSAAGGVGFLGSGLEESAQLENDHFSPGPVTCPDASKIGSVNIKTPLLERELTGFVYLASQDTSPFNSPLVLYVIAEDPVSGVRVKLAGEVQVAANGQLTSVFRNTPPLPYEDLTLHLWGGDRASQATPPRCGTYTALASFGLWSSSEAVPASSQFQIKTQANGEACPEGTPGAPPSSAPLSFGPSFHAGSVNNQAGAFTPFSLTINRPDGNQALQSITMHLPPGAAAILASVTPCPEPQASRNECGPESLVGHSTALSGLGSSPVALGGDVYLTGPYKGAPFGLLAVTRAKAGPFDLGLVPVRSTITVDPYTAAATITSDPLPQLVKGVPSQIKSLNVTVDRPGFEFNPTNCTPMSITGSLSGWEGALDPVSSPFQVTNCASLPFTPKLTVSASHTFSKNNGVSFIVRVTSTHGQANLARTKLVIPKTLPSRLTTIQKACPDSLFNSTPVPGTACGEGSNIGHAIVHTPVLKSPLTGPAYLVSHGGAAFPDVEFVLQGEGILLILDGQTDIKGGVTTSTFNSVPDAPVESFEAILPAGPHSALTVYEPGKTSLCGVKLTAPTTINGQNGAPIEQNTPVAIEGCSGVASFKETSAQKLAKALKACRKNKNKAKRVSCEKAARKRYPAKAKHAKHAKKKK
jgi:hypothetical protein